MQCHVISVYFLTVIYLSGKLVHGGVQVLYPLKSSSTSEKSSYVGEDDDTDDYRDDVDRAINPKFLPGKIDLTRPGDLDKYIKDIQDRVMYGPPTTRRTLFPELTKQLDENMRRLDEEIAKSRAAMETYNNNKAKAASDEYNLKDHLSNNYKSYDNDHHYSGINHDSAISHQDDYDRINKWDNYDHKYDHNDHYGSNDFATSDDSSTKYKKKERSSRKILILAVFLPIALLVCMTTIVFRAKERSRLLSPDRRRRRERQEMPRPCNHSDCCARLPLNTPGCLHEPVLPYNPAMAPLNPHYGTDVMMPQPNVEAAPCQPSALAPTAPVCDLPPSYNEAIAMAPPYTEQGQPSAPPIEQS